jgi:hypothetical protein
MLKAWIRSKPKAQLLYLPSTRRSSTYRASLFEDKQLLRAVKARALALSSWQWMEPWRPSRPERLPLVSTLRYGLR